MDETDDHGIWSDDEPLIRKGSTRPAVVFVLCCGFGGAVAFAALLLRLMGAL